MDKRIAITERYRAHNTRFGVLMDHDPGHAIEEAERLVPDDVLDADLTDMLRAGVLIDAGSRAGDKRAIETGMAILRRLLAREERPDLLYNLGNALVALAALRPNDESWHIATAALRREARTVFGAASAADTDGELLGRIRTNLGNTLVSGHRWLEGYDAYQNALRIDPGNVIAATGAARVLERRAMIAEADEAQVLATLAEDLGSRARGQEARARDLGGQTAVDGLREFLDRPAGAVDLPDLKGRDDYERFIAHHRLALRTMIEGGLPDGKRLDSLRLGSIVERTVEWRGVPPIFAMFNSLKSDYLAARYACFIAQEKGVPETGSYADTLDYATYGVHTSLLTLAQRAGLDLLDKIAVAATEYLELPDKPDAVTFQTRWVNETKQGGITWAKALTGADLSRNPGAIALAELSLDLGKDGQLSHKRALRHASTHRFVVSRDMDIHADRGSRLIVYAATRDLERQVIETLQVARAALFYFADLVEHEERRRRKGAGFLPHLHVPDHDWVRGNDSGT